MNDGRLNIVTGAFGFTGKYITRKLLARGEIVRTLTAHPGDADIFEGEVSVAPLDFSKPDKLAMNMEGAGTLYNTYWIRFPYKSITYDKAVENTRILLKAAVDAGIRRVVHISITNASATSRLPYFRGKGILEEAILDSGLSYAIIRPAVIFGDEGILINNIAWFLRRFPIFAVPGDGEYRLQPVFVGDLAQMAVDAAHRSDDVITDAVGPDIFTFNELLRLIAAKVGSRAWIVHLPPGLARLLSILIGYVVNDVVLTSDEVSGLISNLLVTDNPPTGVVRLGDWLEEYGDRVGRRYFSELARHY